MLIFFGFAGEGFKQEEKQSVQLGEQITVGHFTVRHDALRVTQDAQKQMVTGHVTVFEDGAEIGVGGSRDLKVRGSESQVRVRRSGMHPLIYDWNRANGPDLREASASDAESSNEV